MKRNSTPSLGILSNKFQFSYMKIFLSKAAALCVAVLLLMCGALNAQNSLNTGDFSGSTWGVGQAMSASTGGTLIITKSVPSLGDKYFRFFGDGSPCGEYQPTTNGDAFTHSTTVTTPNGNCGSANAWKINVPTASSNVVFKTDGGNDGIANSVAFVVQGTVRTVSTVTRLNPAQDVATLVTATLSGALSTGQAVYLRCTNNSYSTSTVVQMTGSGTTYTASIPSSINTAAASVSYYVFTSGDANVASDGSNADLYTINVNNNGGSNYTYTVPTTYYSKGSLAAQTASNWNTLRNGTGTNASSFASGSAYVVQNGHTMTVGSSHTFTSGATLLVESGGIYTQSSALTMSGTMIVLNGGKYIHGNSSGGTVPAATWNTGSTCEIQVGGSSAPSGLTQSFYHFIWNSSSLSGAMGLGGVLTTINGDFTVTNTGGQSVRFAASQSPTVTIGGNMNINGGTWALCTGAGAPIVNVAGNVNIAGGILDIQLGNDATTAKTLNIAGNLNISSGTLEYQTTATSCWGVINLSGNFNMTGGTLTKSTAAAGTAEFNFSKAGTQTFTKSSGTISSSTTSPLAFKVNNGSTLDFGTNILNGTGPTFSVVSGGGIITANINATGALTLTGTNGSVQATGTRTYNTGANYSFNGASAQVAGLGFTGANNLTVGSSGLTLSAAAAVTGTLTLNGKLTLGANNLTLTGATVSGASSSNYIVTNLTGGVLRSIASGGGSFVFPIGKSTAANVYAPLTITNTGGSTSVYTVYADTSSYPTPANGAGTEWSIAAGTSTTSTLAFEWLSADAGATLSASAGSGITYNKIAGTYTSQAGTTSAGTPNTTTVTGVTSLTNPLWTVAMAAVATTTISTSGISGLSVSPLTANSTNHGILGFSLTRNTTTADFTDLSISAGSGNFNSFSEIRLVKFTGGTPGVYGSGSKTIISTRTTPSTATELFLGFTPQTITTSASYFFIEGDVASGVTGSTTAVTPSIASGDVVMSAGVVSGSASSTAYSFQAFAALDHFTLSGISSPQIAGTPISVTITAKDIYNNTVTSFTSTAAMTTNAGSITPSTSSAFSGGTLTENFTVTQAGTLKNITATASTKTGTSNNFTVDPGVLANFFVEAAGGGAIGTQTAGSSFNIKITARDANNNTLDAGVNTFTGTVDITSNGSLASGSGTTANFTAGVLSSHAVTTNLAGTGRTITATLTSGSETGTSASFTVNGAAVDHFVVEAAGGGAIGTQTAGTPFNIRVTAQDIYNNTANAFTGTVDITSNGSLASGSGTTASFSAGVLASHSVTTNLAGTGRTITATRTGNSETGTSASFTVDPGVLDHFAISSISSPQIAGTNFSATITAQDINNNTVTSFTGTAAMTTNAGTITPSTSSAFTAGVLTENFNVTLAGTLKNITATASGKTGTSNDFTVHPGALNNFLVEEDGGGNISTQISNTPFDIEVTARDAYNNTLSTGPNTFTGTVDITSTGTLSAGSGTTASFSAGVLASHSVTISSTGATTITATLTSGSETGTSNSFSVTGGAPTKLAITNTIGTQIAGTGFSVTVEAQDAGSTPTPVIGDMNVELSLASGTGNLGGTITGVILDGTTFVTIIGVTYDKAESGVSISVVDDPATITPGTSNTFTVEPGEVTNFLVEAAGGGSIGTQVAGTSFNIKITARDQYNNVVSSGANAFSGTVDITSTGTLSAGSGITASFTAGVLASHAVTVTNTGSFTITATKSGDTEAGTSASFSVTAAALNNFVVEAAGGGGISAQTSGVPFNIQVTAKDVYGNTLSSGANTFTGTVDITSTGILSAGSGTTASFTAGVLSSHSVTISNTGSFTITATRTGFSETGTSASFNVNAGVLDHFAISSISSPQIAGTIFSVTITAQDASNNTLTSFTGTTAMTTNAGTISPSTSNAFTAGVLTQDFYVTQAGTLKNITATRTGFSETGTSNNFTVDPGALNNFLVEAAGGGALGTQTAGASFNIQVTARDLYNNTLSTGANTFTGTVGITSGTGTISAGGGTTASFTAGVLSSHAVTFTNAGSNTITATLTSGSETGTSASFTVNGAAVDHFVITNTSNNNITTQTAGVAFAIKIVAQDVYNNTATGFTGTVDITSTGTLSGGTVTSATFTAGVLASQNVTITSVGTGYTLTATRTSGSETGTSNTFDVTYTSTAGDDFRSNVNTGNWGTVASWESKPTAGSTWYTATLAPTSAANSVTIRNTDTITIATTTLSIGNTTVQDGGKLVVQGVLTVISAKALTIDVDAGNGGGTVEYQASNNNATSNSPVITSSGGLIVNGNYIINPTTPNNLNTTAPSDASNYIPITNTTYGTSSFVIIKRLPTTDSKLRINGSIAGTVVFDVQSGTDGVSPSYNYLNASGLTLGALTIKGTGAGYISHGTGGTTRTLTITNDVTVQGGSYSGAGGSATGANNLTINGNVIISGGILTASNSTGNNASVLSIKKNITISGGTLTNFTGSGTGATLSINGTIAQTIAASGSYTFGNVIAANSHASGITATTDLTVGTLSVSSGIFSIASTKILTSSNSVAISSGATLAGTGTVSAAVALTGIISPNTSGTIGSLTTGNITLNSGSSYRVDINNIPSAGSAGTNWDFLAAGVITNSGGTTITLNGTISGFSSSTAYTWIIGSYTGTAPATTGITVNTTGLSNSLGAGSFSLNFTSGNVNLVFTPGICGAGSATFNFTTNLGSTAITNLTISPFVQGNNNGTTTFLDATSPSTGAGTYAGASGVNNGGFAARTGAINTGASGSAYLEFTLTPAAGNKVSLTGITFGSRSTGTGPAAFTLRSSLDGYTADLATGSLSTGSTWAFYTPTTTISTSATATAITYRMFGYNGTGSPGANTANWRIDDLTMLVAVTDVTTIPAITSPLCNGVTTVSGTVTLADGNTVSVYKNGIQAGTATIASNAWSATVSALTTGDVITATSSTGGCASLSSSSVTVQAVSAAPVITGTYCATSTSVTGTSSEADGTVIEVFINGSTAGTTTVTGNAWTKTGLTLAASDALIAKATASGKCVSLVSSTVTVQLTSATPVVDPVCAGSTTITGTSSEVDGTTIEVFVNAVSAGTTTVSGGIWSKTVTAVSAGNTIYATALATGKCVSANASTVTVAATSTATADIDQFVCDGGSVTLNGGGTGTGTWSVVAGSPSTNNTQFSPGVSTAGATFTPDGGTGVYALVWSVTNSPCTTATDTVLIYVQGAGGWVGGASGDWNTAANWCGGNVPDASSNVIVPAGANINIQSANAVANSVTIDDGGTLTMSGAYNLTLTSGGSFTTNTGGTLTSTSSTGAVIFAGSGSTGGTTTFGNLILNGSVAFNATTTIGTSLQINSGGIVSSNSPIYSSGATLIYSSSANGSGNKYQQALEWPATNGPTHVTLTNGNWVELTSDRSLTGNLTVTNGALQSNGQRTLTMNGTTQTITVSNSTGGAIYGTDNGFGNDLILTIASGSTTTWTGDATGGNDDEKKLFNINVNSGGTLALSRGILSKYGTFTVAGILQLNANGYVQQTAGGNAKAPTYSGTGSLVYNSGGSYTMDFEWSGAGSTVGYGVPYSVTVQNTGTALTIGAARSITGTLTVNTGTSAILGAAYTGASSIAGTLQLNSGGTVSAAPTYSSTAVLKYNQGGSVSTSNEWTANGTSAGSGIPQDVTIQNSTTVNMPTSNRGLAGNLDISSGTLILNATSGDIYVGGNWNRTSSGTFTPNDRAVFFNGSTASTIKAPESSSKDGNGSFGGETFPYLLIDKTAKATAVKLLSNIAITKTMTITQGTLDLDTSDVVFASNTSVTADLAPVNTTNADISYSGSGRFIPQRYIGNNSTIRTWRFLTAPLQADDPLTINDAWQEGQVNPNRLTPNETNPWPGFGTHITGPGNLYDFTKGFDQGLGNNGNSIEYFDNSSGSSKFSFPPNTKSTRLMSQLGWGLFVRGDRSIVIGTQYTNSGNTTLEPKGKINIGDVTSTVTGGGLLFNVIGNPYPCQINMTNVEVGGNIHSNFSLWDPKAYTNYTQTGKYIPFTWLFGTTYTASNSPVTTWANPGTVESGEAFLAKSATTSVVFHESDKVAGTSSMNGIQSRPTPSSPAGITISTLRTNLGYYETSTSPLSYIDGTLNLFSAGYNTSVDKFEDVILPMSGSTTGAIRIAKEGYQLAISKEKIIEADDTVFLNISTLKPLKHLLAISAKDFVPDASATLVDKYLNTNTALSLISGDSTFYEFDITADALSNRTDRFMIIFKPLNTTPVALSSVKASQQNGGVAVEWKVESEVNTKSYVVEKSSDGVNFTKVTTVAATNYASSASYNWLDVAPLNGDNFYRIRIIDQSGVATVSQIVKVKIGNVKAEISIYPNPIVNGTVGLQLVNMPKGDYKVKIINIVGQTIFNKTIKHLGGSSTETLSLDKNLARGLYKLEIIDSNKNQTVITLAN
ncbi:MAG: T9SS type A sorting domain-containing protein [Bacteroidota bacterium]